MILFSKQVERNSDPNLFGAQTGVADDQREGRIREFTQFCQFWNYLGICFTVRFSTIAST